jgi:hypothetical protein
VRQHLRSCEPETGSLQIVNVQSAAQRAGNAMTNAVETLTSTVSTTVSKAVSTISSRFDEGKK